MKPAFFTVLGLGLDIVGVFLLSVEAIKLENLRALRDKVIGRAHSAILSPILKSAFKDDLEEERARRSVVRWYFSHLTAGAALALAVVLTFPEERRISESWWVSGTGWPAITFWLVIAAAIFLISVLWPLSILRLRWKDARMQFGLLVWMSMFPPTLIFMLLGEALHQTALWVLRATIAVLSKIDHLTPTGTIGILGFFLTIVGFLLQIVGTLMNT